MTSLPSLRARELAALLRELAPSQPILIWSRAGAGKTALVHLHAEAADLEVLAVAAADLPGCLAPAELTSNGGFQAPRMTARPRPVMVHVTGVEDPGAGPGLEALVDERRLGRYRLPDGSPLVAEARLGRELAPRVGAGVASRFLQVVLEPDLEDWRPWAEVAGVAPVILRYLLDDPARLVAAGSVGGPASSPRSWAAVGRALAGPGLSGPAQEALLHGLLAPADARALGARLLTAAGSHPTVRRDPGGDHGRRHPARPAAPAR